MRYFRGGFQKKVIEFSFLISLSGKLTGFVTNSHIYIASAWCSYGAAGVLVKCESTVKLVADLVALVLRQGSHDESQSTSREY